ncbi:MAG: hypothetical protein F7C32_00790 [Desulfurococcales archaeon]|nr:hypothetical protein [Desulfurococcales archaeon]
MVSFDRYPFLFDLDEYSSTVYGYTVSLDELFENKRLAELSIKRLTTSIRKKSLWDENLSSDENFLTFHMAAALAKQLGVRSIITRFALHESDKAYVHLLKENTGNIMKIAARLGIRLVQLENALTITLLQTRKGRTVKWILEFGVPLYPYLKYSTRLRGDPRWKLVNKPVKEGIVYLERRDLLRFLKEAFYYRIIEVIDNIDILPSSIEKLVDRVKEQLPKTEKTSLRGEVGGEPVDFEILPPCIKRIHEALLRGENLSHAERFAYATFMLAIGASVEELVELFRNLPDFKEKITRYQLEHLAGKRGGGKKYSPYNCENMKSRGLCIAECGVSHPLTYYYSKLKKRARPPKVGTDKAGERS